jgi:3-oxoacyl-[acyl-carrier protein] reductase
MDLSLEGRRAWVGGASQGIGLACARALAGLGASVVLASRSPDRLERARATLPADRGQAHAIAPVDLADGDAVDAAATRALEAGPIHVLVNNTGGPPEGTALENDPSEYEAAFCEHVGSAQRLARAFLPGMRDAGFGRIVNVTSTSVKVPFPILAISNTVRAGLVNWAKTLSLEVAADGITVNNVLPGLTATDRLAQLIESWSAGKGVTPEAFTEQMRQSVPARRLGDPEEIAAAVAFLASPAASYVNGVNLPVDGGRLPTL